MPYIAHSYKGTSWKKHKYIRKEGERYFYKQDKNGYIYDADKDEWINKKTGETASDKEVEKIEMTRDIVESGKKACDDFGDTLFWLANGYYKDEAGPNVGDVIKQIKGEENWFTYNKLWDTVRESDSWS